MPQSGVFTVRVSAEKQQQIDELARQMDRPRNWVVNQAIDHYLEIHAWQIEQIQKGIDEADQGDLVPHEQVMDEIAAKLRHAQP